MGGTIGTVVPYKDIPMSLEGTQRKDWVLQGLGSPVLSGTNRQSHRW